jgi:hypothetical protein
MKRELESLIERHNKSNEDFREQVRCSLASLQSRKEEANRSTRHGHQFEQVLLDFLERNAAAAGDIAERTASTPGLIKNCKVGDAVLSIGPEREAAGAKIVVEGKQRAGYDLKRALTEMDVARRNRGAGVGLFVFAKRLAPTSMSPLTRYGNDIVVVWDAEDTSSDIYLEAALSVARALCIEGAVEKALDFDLERIRRAVNEVQRQIACLEEIRKGAHSIRSTAEKIEDKSRIVADSLSRCTATLDEEIRALKAAVADRKP